MSIWKTIEEEAKRCQRAWGLSFPVISARLLQTILAEGLGKFGWTKEVPTEDGEYWIEYSVGDELHRHTIEVEIGSDGDAAFYDEFYSDSWNDSVHYLRHKENPRFAKIPTPDEITEILGGEVGNDVTDRGEK